MDEYEFKHVEFPSSKVDNKMTDDSPNAKEVGDSFDLLGLEPTPAATSSSTPLQPSADSLLHHDVDDDLDLLSGSTSPRSVSSTNRPLVTPAVDEDNIIRKSGSDNANNLLFDDDDNIKAVADYSLPTAVKKEELAEAARHSFANDDVEQQQQPSVVVLAPTVSIEDSSTTGFSPGVGSVHDSPALLLNDDDEVAATTTSTASDDEKKKKQQRECESVITTVEDLLPKHPKIGTKAEEEESTSGINKKDTSPACDEPIAHSANTDDEKIVKHSSAPAAAMEAEPAGKTDDGSCCCFFSPGAWFNPEKLHPCVAELMYWRDVKKSGVVFGSVLVLLLSLKYFSCISVAAYLTIAVLAVTMSFRIYKSILQAVQKSNEGPPFKEYLDINIDLSHEKLKDASGLMIHHVNSFTNKMRSLILVEDLFDTFKLLLFAWCMTYVGAWLNGMTVVILAFVSAFTMPKVYETNKTQIDAYAEIIRTKGKEVMEMVNSKIPLGKKKKEE